MREFGWTIEYVMSLSFPIFFELSYMLKRLRSDASIDEFYMPYGAAKYGGKCSDSYFKGSGFYLENATVLPGYTHEMLERAKKRAEKIRSGRSD